MYNDAKLVVLSGKEKRQQKIIDRGYMLPAEAGSNPELLGAIPIIGSIASGIDFITGLWDKITDGSDTDDLIKAQMLQQQQQAAQFNKIMIFAGVGIAGVMVISLMTSKKS